MTPRKLDEVRCIVKSFRNTIHFLILTETWIKNEDQAKRTQIDGYKHYYSYRPNNRGGGVSIFAVENLEHYLIEEYSSNGNHFVWIHAKSFSFDIGAVYRKPDHTNIKNFFECYSRFLQKSKRMVILGDFNLNLLGNDSATLDYNNILNESSCKIMNRLEAEYCTRETSTSKSIIDHVCCSLIENSSHLALIETPLSDHKQIYFEIKKNKPKQIKKTMYDSINYDQLSKHMTETINKENCNYELLEQRILACINKSKKFKYKIQNRPRQDWINKNIIKEINKRNILWKEHKSDPNDLVKKENFIKKRNQVSNIIQKEKSQYYQKKLGQCTNKPKKMWSLINSLSQNKIKDITMPPKLMTSNGFITKADDIANYFNDYFSNIGSNLANQIPKKYHDLRTFNTLSKKGESNDNNVTLTHFTHTNPQEVAKIIQKLNSNTSTGIDGISTKSLKCISPLILEELSNCINTCLDQGTFPDSLKLAKVTPIYKSGCRNDPSNYRPISVLPVMSKIFERILYNRLEGFLTKRNFFYAKQYGFRAKSNTLSATIDLITKIKTNIDNKQVALGIFIDLKKAFDTISHSKLLKKLKDIGIDGVAHNILKSYLSGRRQTVKIGENTSKPDTITYGIPQGSIIGPLLFIIYINSIQDLQLIGDVNLYADDTSIFYFGHQVNLVIAQAQRDLDRLNEWFLNNLLTINVTKTNYIIFSAKNKKIASFSPLTINNKIIKKVNEEKYLGLILDSHLTWKPHLQKLKTKLSSLSGMLRGFVRCIPNRLRHTIYNTLIKPHIDYLIEVWGTAAVSNLTPIQTAQNILIKKLFNYDFLTPTQKIYRETKVMTITQSYKYQTCILVRKILSGDIHTQIKFTNKGSIHNIGLRSKNDILLPRSRTNYGKKSIIHEGAKIYNELPKDIKETKTMTSFKIKLKNHIAT